MPQKNKEGDSSGQAIAKCQPDVLNLNLSLEIKDEEEGSHGKQEPKGGSSTSTPDKGNKREKEAKTIQEGIPFTFSPSQAPCKIDGKNHRDPGEIIPVYEKSNPRYTLARIDT